MKDGDESGRKPDNPRVPAIQSSDSTSLPATAATREAASATRGLGHGEEDMAVLVKHIETLAGVEVRDEQ